MTEPQTFIPQPLSVHTFDEEAFRASWGRLARVAASVPAVVAVVLGAAHVVLVIVRGQTDWFDGLGFVLACTCACAVFVAVIFLVGYWWSVRFGRVTRVEVWPDCIISRIEGRPPLVVRQDEAVSVLITEEMVCIEMAGHWSSDLVVPSYVVDFDTLCEHVRTWRPSRPKPRLRLLPALWRLAVVVAVIGLLPDNPLIVTAGSALAVGVSTLAAWRIWRGEHRAKWERRLVWILPGMLLLSFGFITLLKWLDWCETSPNRVMRSIFPWW